jgi:hypothetical protein
MLFRPRTFLQDSQGSTLTCWGSSKWSDFLNTDLFRYAIFCVSWAGLTPDMLQLFLVSRFFEVLS